MGIHDKYRGERFLPFYLVLAKKTEEPRYGESVNIARYFLQNAVLRSKADETFYYTLKAVTPEGVLDLSSKSPLPLQDYLKVLYDLKDK